MKSNHNEDHITSTYAWVGYRELISLFTKASTSTTESEWLAVMAGLVLLRTKVGLGDDIHSTFFILLALPSPTLLAASFLYSI